MIKETVRIAGSGILSGLYIGIAALLFLKVGGGIVGALLFSVGLIAVVCQKTLLYTGQAWKYTPWSRDIWKLLLVWIFNILAVGALAALFGDDVIELSEKIVATRLEKGFWMDFLLSIPCGLLMTTAVKSYEKNGMIPVIGCVMAFILCGFPHCIADVFYYAACGWPSDLFIIYLGCVAGNYIGCNLYRLAQIP